ncbi:MAG: helix-turn-helix transcriptional regulator [Nakamurella sp.]
MPDTFQNQLGLRLRAVRRQLALTLDEVEANSDGKWKAVTIGSYERGERAVTAVTLLEIADFYGVPGEALLPGHALPCRDNSAPTIRINLRRLAAMSIGKVGTLAHYAATIRSQRDGRRRDVLEIGPDGMRLMAAIQGATPMDLYCQLIDWGVTPVDEDDTVRFLDEARASSMPAALQKIAS